MQPMSQRKSEKQNLLDKGIYEKAPDLKQQEAEMDHIFPEIKNNIETESRIFTW